MSRYVDIDELIRRYESCGFVKVGAGNFPQAIDIVRCQDCKYWVYNFNGCSRNPCTEPWLAEDFCSYGEVRDE